MRWLERLENRMHWIAFPGLLKYLALCGVVVTAWGWMSPTAAEAISFDRDKILAGEVWRIFSFALAPTGMFSLTPLGVIFLYFATMIAFMVSDSLEEVWGATRTTLYLLTCWLGLVGGQFLLGVPVPLSGVFIEASMFLAFATYFPKVEFRLFFILPIQVRWLAWLALAGMVYSVIVIPPMICIVLPTLVPYGLWVLPGYIQSRKGLVKAAARRRRFEAASLPDDNAFHRCEVCNRTEHDDADLEFRTDAEGNEFCVDHLPEDQEAS